MTNQSDQPATISWRLHLPGNLSLDRAVLPWSTLRQAAELLPVSRVSQVSMFGAEDLERIAADDQDPFAPLVGWVGWSIALRYSPQGEPFLPPDGVNALWEKPKPRRAIGMTVQLDLDHAPCHFIVAEYPERHLVRGVGPAAARSYWVPTTMEGWYGSGEATTGGAGSNEFSFLTSHLCIVALLDSLSELGVVVEVTDQTGFFRERSIIKLLQAHQGSGSLGWPPRHVAMDCINNLADLTRATDQEFFPGFLG